MNAASCGSIFSGCQVTTGSALACAFSIVGTLAVLSIGGWVVMVFLDSLKRLRAR